MASWLTSRPSRQHGMHSLALRSVLPPPKPESSTVGDAGKYSILGVKVMHLADEELVEALQHPTRASHDDELQSEEVVKSAGQPPDDAVDHKEQVTASDNSSAWKATHEPEPDIQPLRKSPLEGGSEDPAFERVLEDAETSRDDFAPLQKKLEELRVEPAVKGPEPEKDDAVAAAAQPAKTKPQDQNPDADHDFDFSGDGRPYRFARGKASRVGKDKAARALAQLRGKERVEFTDKDGTIRHAGPLSPFGGMSTWMISAIRDPFRDFIVGEVRDAFQSKSCPWGEYGLRYASLGSDELLFDLELLERIRDLGVHVSQVCLIDPDYQWPRVETKRALREFADWQRAASYICKMEPPEILTFGCVEDYLTTSMADDRVAGSHLLVHCDDCIDGFMDTCERLALQTLKPGGILARLSVHLKSNVMNHPISANCARPHSDCGHNTGLFTLGAWTLGEGKRRTLRPISDQLRRVCTANLAACSFATPNCLAMRSKARALAWTQAEAPALEEKLKAEERAKARAEAQEMAKSWAHLIDNALHSAQPQQAQEKLVVEMTASTWKVVCKPHTTLRAKPAHSARIVGVLYTGQQVLVAEKNSENWLRVVEAPNHIKMSGEAWVLSEFRGVSKDIRLVPIEN